jgi:hypothetical protein
MDAAITTSPQGNDRVKQTGRIFDRIDRIFSDKEGDKYIRIFSVLSLHVRSLKILSILSKLFSWVARRNSLLKDRAEAVPKYLAIPSPHL